MVNIPNSSFPSLKVFKALAQLADLPFTWKCTHFESMSYLLKMHQSFIDLARAKSEASVSILMIKAIKFKLRT